MWTASLDHLFRVKQGQWSLHPRLEPVIQRWHALELRPSLWHTPAKLDVPPEQTTRADLAGSECEARQPTAATSQPRLVDVTEAPAYLKRPYIFKYYLIGGNEQNALVQTLFTWTNETMNAWTMMVGLCVALGACQWSRQNLPSEQMPFLIYALSSILHLPFSVKLHCSIGVSQQSREYWRALDVLFILICSVPRGAALAWYVFTSPASFWTYIAIISAIDAAHVTSLFILHPTNVLDRIIVSKRVASMMLCFTAPLMTACAYELMYYGIGPCVLLTAAIVSCLVAGGLAYVHRVPERWFPGMLDLVGNSHQLMHVFIVLGYALEGLFIYHMALVKLAGQASSQSSWVDGSSDQPVAVAHLLAHLHQSYTAGQVGL